MVWKWNENETTRNISDATKHTHTRTAYNDLTHLSGVMPIVASCWQNEFPRNLFVLKTYDNDIYTRNKNTTRPFNSLATLLLLLLLPSTDPESVCVPSPNFWFIINDHYRAVSVSIARAHTLSVDGITKNKTKLWNCLPQYERIALAVVVILLIGIRYTSLLKFHIVLANGELVQMMMTIVPYACLGYTTSLTRLKNNMKISRFDAQRRWKPELFEHSNNARFVWNAMHLINLNISVYLFFFDCFFALPLCIRVSQPPQNRLELRCQSNVNMTAIWTTKWIFEPKIIRFYSTSHHLHEREAKKEEQSLYASQHLRMERWGRTHLIKQFVEFHVNFNVTFYFSILCFLSSFFVPTRRALIVHLHIHKHTHTHFAF